ncbi:MAG TPA: Gfo/Idh/MocA family oxidoreductase [Opitutus sp.]|nr:Gfo/Idh/MocA family oxidoreductase [Opitutus sp.]
MKTAAIIGISRYARYHLLIALEQALHGKLRLAAAVIINPEEEAFFRERLSRLGCEIFENTETMWLRWSGRIDLCFIPTGIHLHAPMTLQALAAGANVLVEKPLTATIAEGEAIMQAEREMGRFVAVGFQDVYTDSTWTIKQRLLAGEIGRIRAITLVGLWPRHNGYYLRNEWAGRLMQEGQWVLDSPINNAFAHFLNLGLFWAGSRLDASASVESVECELYRVQEIETFDTCCIRARLTEGPELRVYATHSCREERVPCVVLEGSGGTMEWVQESHCNLTTKDGRKERIPVPGKFETKFMMMDAVLARIDNPQARICGTAIAIKHLHLVEAVHKAVQVVDVPDEFVQRRVVNSSTWKEIVGIEATIDESSRNGRLFSELSVPWAGPAGCFAFE